MNISDPFFDEEWDSEFGIAHREDEDIEAILRGIEIFSSLTHEELSLIERIIHLRTYLPNEVIVSQGAPGVGMYIIQTGVAHVLLEVPQGEVIHLATLGERQFFGEMSLLDGTPRAASVVSRERTRIIGFFRADLMDLVSQSPRLGLKIIYRLSQLMAMRLSETLRDYRMVQQELLILQGEDQKGDGKTDA